MTTPTDSLTDPLEYAPKWARDAAIAERRNATRQDRVSKRNESPDDSWPTEWSPAARSVDPIVLAPPPSRLPLRVWFAIGGGLAISAAAGAITALFVVGKLPSWGLVPKDAGLEAASFETRFIGQDDQTDGASPSSAAIKQPRLAEPLRQTDGTSPGAAANEEPRLAEPLRQTDGASPGAAANDEPRLAEPLRGTTMEHVTDRQALTPSALNPDAIAASLQARTGTRGQRRHWQLCFEGRPGRAGHQSKDRQFHVCSPHTQWLDHCRLPALDAVEDIG
jgi:hypothetical protein